MIWKPGKINDKDFKRHIVERKREFGKKIENKFQEGNPREAWKGLKLMTGFGDQKKQCNIIGNNVFKTLTSFIVDLIRVTKLF